MRIMLFQLWLVKMLLMLPRMLKEPGKMHKEQGLREPEMLS
jgi:hypothetical protein